MKTFWTTFYSYKGGVGRSLALANVAALLVNRGRRVLLIDFDLDAPGLDSFCEFSEAKAKPGVIEYTSEFLLNKCAPNIANFVHECPFATTSRGKLWIMPAGRKDHAYNRQLHEINWIKLYEDGLGKPFVDNWKAAIEDTYKPDFVLIDSRTGITEIGGICTVQFPDLVVMLFGLNDQNLRGIHSVAKAISDSKASRIPQISYVATPIPSLLTDQQGLLKQRLDIATKTLGTKVDYFIRYYAQAALEEKLFVLSASSPEPPIIQDYRTLQERIIDLNSLGLDFLIKESQKAIQDGDDERIQGLLAMLKKDFAHDSEAIFLQAQLVKQLGNSEDAIELTEQAFTNDPTYLSSFQELERYYKRKKNPEKIASLCDIVLSRKHSLSPKQIYDFYFAKGQYLMEAGKCSDAHTAFEQAKTVFETARLPSNNELPILFNIAESRRRSIGTIIPLEWTNVISSFEKRDMTSITLDFLASHCQAMHIAYAVTGNPSKAMQCLYKAEQAASAINDAGVFFTPKFYRFIVKPEFIAVNKEMIRALEQNQLWDGTTISPLSGKNA